MAQHPALRRRPQLGNIAGRTAHGGDTPAGNDGARLHPLSAGAMDLVMVLGLLLCILVSLSHRARISIKTRAEIEEMRHAGRMAAEVLEVIEPHVVPGVTTAELDRIAAAHITAVQHAVAAPLHYGGITGGALLSLGQPGRSACKVAAHATHYALSMLSWVVDILGAGGRGQGRGRGGGFFFGLPLCGFPASVCVSVNEEVCHGVPSTQRRLQRGDLANVDVTVINDRGFHGDTSVLFAVGGSSAPKPRAALLRQVAREALFHALRIVRPGTRLGDIGAIVERHARAHGFSVVREYSGHGIGTVFHEGPRVLHFGRAGTGEELKAGMTLTIEPMLNEKGSAVRVLADQWTVITADGGWSAQWEHTVLVTETGCEVLTVRQGEQAPDTVPMTLPRHNVSSAELQRVRQELIEGEHNGDGGQSR